MYLVKILNADHRPVDVEVSLEIYRVYEESRKQEERQRYEHRKHIEGKSFDDCLLYDLATEPLEETVERLETLLEIGQVLEKLPPLLICTPKVRHFWRCIFLWEKQKEKTKCIVANLK